MRAGVDAVSYFGRRFPDVESIDSPDGDNANCAEWLLSITTKVRHQS